jgi:hypothetical protein
VKLADLIEAKRAEIADITQAYDAATARQRGIIKAARDEGRDQLTRLEAEEVESLRQEAQAAEKRHDAAKRALDELERAAADEQRVEAEQKDVRETAAADGTGQPGGESRAKPAYDQIHRVGQEKRTYNPAEDKNGRQFLRDVASQFLNRSDYGAHDRLARHMQEETVERGAETLKKQQRAVGTGAFAGLVVPQYLTDMYAPAVAALRPFADACNKHDLPESGMTLNISRITTATSTALQATENSAVSETNIDDTLLTINVQTAAGQQTISRQAIERGSGVEEVTIQDLFKRLATTLDSTLLNQATTGLSAVATSNAYTDASPTATELYPKILQAAAGSEAALLGLATPDIAVLHSRRWYWLQSQLTSTWPLFQQNNLPSQSGGEVNSTSRYGSGFRGMLPSGLAVIVDNSVVTNSGAGTNEDEIYVVPSEECHLWEDPSAPLFIRADQPAAASLGVLLVVYSYFGYTFGRFPASMQKIAGTGLVTPTF